MDFDLPVARVYLPDRTLLQVVVRARGGRVDVMAPRSLELVTTFNITDATFRCGANQCGDPNVKARWALVTDDGTHVLAEHIGGCGCGGWYSGGPDAEKLAMA